MQWPIIHVSSLVNNYIIILVNVTKDISTKQQGGIISNNLSNFYLIAPKIQICTVPLTVFCLFLKYHEKWFARVISVFQHLNRMLISVFVFRPNCKPAGRCRGWGLAIQVTFWLKLSMILKFFLASVACAAWIAVQPMVYM